MKLRGKVALVTGAASGIGAALSEALVRRSCRVTLADIDSAGVRRTARRLSALGTGLAVPVTLDVRDAPAVAAAVQQAAAEQGRLDLLFNNAGIGMGGEARELRLEHWQRVIDVNLYGLLHGVVAAYPLMLAQGFGHIVNMSSLAGVVPYPGGSPYATTKFAVVGLSLSLRAEAAERGVRVSVVCPGGVDTPLLDKKHHDGLPTTPSVESTDQRAFVVHMNGPLYSAQRLAQDVIRGVEANRAVIVAPASARMTWRLARFLPGLTLRVGTRRFERERQIWGWTTPAGGAAGDTIGDQTWSDVNSSLDSTSGDGGS